MSMEYKLPLTAKEVEEVLVKGKEVLPNIEQYKGLEEVAEMIFSYDSPNWNSIQYGYYIDIDNDMYELLSQSKFAQTVYPHPSECETVTMSTFEVSVQGYDGVRASDFEPKKDIAVLKAWDYDYNEVTRLVVSNEYYRNFIEPYYNSSPGLGHSIKFYA